MRNTLTTTIVLSIGWLSSFFSNSTAFAQANGTAQADVPAQPQPSLVYDHHVHVLSPRLISDWKSLGMSFSRPDQAYSDPEQIIKQEGVAGAFLISMAHLYTNEDFRQFCPTPEMEHRLVAAENDYVAVSVARAPARFVGFYSVNPLRDYSFEELRRCHANPNLKGLKLHLPTCGVDLDNRVHVESLGKVLAWAAENKVPVLLHWTAGEEIDLQQSLKFWSEVIQPHRNLELYLAHLGSIGGYNRSTANILRGFSHVAQESDEFRNMKIFFDLSGAIIPADFPEGEPTSDESCQELANWMKSIGVERFLFASDYPVFSVATTKADLATRLSLSESELQRLFENKSPQFGR